MLVRLENELIVLLLNSTFVKITPNYHVSIKLAFISFLVHDLKNWINSKVTSPLLNRNKESVKKDNRKVNFLNDCVFNQKTEEKYEKTNKYMIVPHMFK